MLACQSAKAAIYIQHFMTRSVLKCRQYEYAKAQQTAMRLHRAEKQPHWLWCAITLLALQAMQAESPTTGATKTSVVFQALR